MAKGMYVGVNNVARKGKKMYFSPDGIARKVKKAYIGVGGMARPFWSGGELAYYGTITALSKARTSIASTAIGDYALLAGGYTGTSASNVVDVYDSNLTKSIASTLSVSRYNHKATSVGNYAVIAGGYTGSSGSNVTDAFDTSLTRSTPTALGSARYYQAATTVGNYAIFGGGVTGSGSASGTVYAYNRALSRSVIDSLYTARRSLAATTVGGLALFAGGHYVSSNTYMYPTVVDVFDTMLTKSTVTGGLPVGSTGLGATTVGDYAIFAGGLSQSSPPYATAFDGNLTKISLTRWSSYQESTGATTVDNKYALFNSDRLGGILYAYDASLTMTSNLSLSVDRRGSTVSIGNYALVCGGKILSISTEVVDTVDAYTAA